MSKFDPKLKEAMEDMKVILKKYDIGAHISLVSPTHSEFLFHISPTWSCAKFEDDGKAIRFKATEISEGSKEARHKTQELTLHLLLQIRDLSGQSFMTMEKIQTELKKHIDFEHKPFSQGE